MAKRQGVGWAHTKPVRGVAFDPTGRFMVSWASDGAKWWDLEKKTGKELFASEFYGSFTYESGVFTDGVKTYKAETGDVAPLPTRTRQRWQATLLRGEAPFILEENGRTIYTSPLTYKGYARAWNHPDGWALVQKDNGKEAEYYRLERDLPPKKIGTLKYRDSFGDMYGVFWIPGTSLLCSVDDALVFDASRGRVVWRDKGFKARTGAPSADGTRLMLADRFTLNVYEVKSGKRLKTIAVNKDTPAPFTSGWNIWPSPAPDIWAMSPYHPSERDSSQRQLLVQRGSLIALNDENVGTRILAKAADTLIARNKAWLQQLEDVASPLVRPVMEEMFTGFIFKEKARTALVPPYVDGPWLETTVSGQSMAFLVAEGWKIGEGYDGGFALETQVKLSNDTDWTDLNKLNSSATKLDEWGPSDRSRSPLLVYRRLRLALQIAKILQGRPIRVRPIIKKQNPLLMVAFEINPKQ